MKTRLLKLITVTAFFAVALVGQAQTVINTVYEDANIVSDGTTATVQAWVTDSFVGASAVGTNNCTVIPFQLPDNGGESVVDASFEALLTKIDAWVGGDVDMYAIEAREAATVLDTDYYIGAYGTDTNPDVTPIASGYMTTATTLGVVATDAAANTALIAFLNTQYAAGNVNKYVFIRLSPSMEWTNYQRYWITGYNNSTSPTGDEAKLTITFGTLGVDDLEKSTLGLYPNPVTDGRLRVSLDGFGNDASLEIYSLTGQLVHREAIQASSSTDFETNINLNTGLYIVKLQDGITAKTQKLMVQ